MIRRVGTENNSREKSGEQTYAAAEKVALAWWLRTETTVLLRWVGDRLRMGHYRRVSQAVGRVNRKPAKKLRRLLQTLAELDEK